MKTRPASSTDIDNVWPRLAERMTEEYKLAGYALGVVKGIFLKIVKAGHGETYLSDEGIPLAVMTWQPDPNGGYATSFAGTDDFFLPVNVRPFRRYLIDLQTRLGGPRLVSHSFSKHPSVEKWFATLGFTLVSKDGVYRKFVREPS